MLSKGERVKYIHYGDGSALREIDKMGEDVWTYNFQGYAVEESRIRIMIFNQLNKVGSDAV